MLLEMLRKWMPRSRRQHPSRRTTGPWRLLRLEERAVPAIGFVIGSGPNNATGKQVEVYDTTGALIFAFDAFPGFTGGAHVATGDLNGDGVADIVVGAGAGGGPHVKVFDGAAIQLGGSAAANAVANPLKSFYAYNANFSGGVYVAVGDINGQTSDGTPTGTRLNNIVTGAGPGGGPHVEAFQYSNLAVLFSFYAYNSAYPGGVSVAAGDVGGDTGNPPIHPVSSDEIVTGALAGAMGGSHVKIYAISLTSDTALDLVGQFYAYDPVTFNGGTTVAVGNVTNNMDASGNHYADIITAAGPGGGPEVKVWRLDNGQNTGTDSLFSFVVAADYYAYSANFTGGVTVGVTPDVTSDGLPDIITGAGPGGGPHEIIWGSKSLLDLQTYQPPLIQQEFVYDSSFTGGIFVS